MLRSSFLILTLATVVTATTTKPAEKFYIFREDCFVSKDWTNPDCLKFTGNKVLGLVSSFGAIGLKVPQILKIMGNGSAEGISAVGMYVDTTNNLSLVGNSLRLDYGFGIWGGPFFVGIQNVIIIVLCWRYC